MSVDPELLADFLVEAGELVDVLGEQLMHLEDAPDDMDTLNAVFRTFHTVKGGAGFLELTELVGLCHKAEEVCNALRNGKASLTPEMMDVLSDAVTVLQRQVDGLRAGEAAEAAPAELLERLAGALAAPSPPPAPVPEAPAAAPAASPDAITDDEFEALLDELHGQGGGPSVAPPVADGVITDDEFEAVLDQLHGPAGAPGVAAAPAVGAGEPKTITEDEFEQLLDELHGPAGAPGAETAAPVSAPAVEPTAAEVSAPPAPEPAAVAVSAPPVPEPAAKAPPKAAPKAVAEPTIRVDTRRLDAVMNLVGELVLVRNRLKILRDETESEEVDKAIASLDIVTGHLQTGVMKIRMQPVSKVFSRFPKIVRDLARSLGKEIDLQMVGEDTELDKNLVEALSDPLVHMVRNSVDHGVEMPDVREAHGKPRKGTLQLAARQEGDHIVISIADDGAGMDANVLRAKAIEKGIMDRETAARLSAQDCLQIIFMPGFSTRQEVSDVSGRGVGMDVVKTRIDELKGHVMIESEVGVGTRFELRLPLTLAILATLMVNVSHRVFAIPLSSVDDVIVMDPDKIRILDGRKVLMFRDDILPIMSARTWAGDAVDPSRRSSHIVIMSSSNGRFGLVVDSVRGREEVVIKPLGAMLQQMVGFSGATVTGDGRVALILDPAGLFKIVQRFSD